MGVSLGKINYCLKALISRGWIKARNFSDSPNKSGYLYVLTPCGLEEKARVARRFLAHKLAEYEAIQWEIVELQQEVACQEEEDFMEENIKDKDLTFVGSSSKSY